MHCLAKLPNVLHTAILSRIIHEGDDGEMALSEAECDNSDLDSTWSMGRHDGMARPAKYDTEGDAGALMAVNIYSSTMLTAVPCSSATSIAAPPPKPEVKFFAFLTRGILCCSLQICVEVPCNPSWNDYETLEVHTRFTLFSY